MKKYIITSLLLFVPFMSMAADHCTDPKEYTIDKRCYVTNEQKKQKPYNGVVAILDGSRPYCTGFIREYEGNFFVYTAKHCVVDEIYKAKVYDKITIRTQSGNEIDADFNRVGDFDVASNPLDRQGDYAIYYISSGYKDRVKNLSVGLTKKKWQSKSTYNARVVGYGALKIMSDKEITDFKNEYKGYLAKKQINVKPDNEKKYYFEQGGVLAVYDDLSGRDVLNKFLLGLGKIKYEELFENTELKVSRCGFDSVAKPSGCQIWRGNSGGPVFDDSDNVMGILTGFNGIIGGENHAGADSSVDNVHWLTW